MWHSCSSDIQKQRLHVLTKPRTETDAATHMAPLNYASNKLLMKKRYTKVSKELACALNVFPPTSQNLTVKICTTRLWSADYLNRSLYKCHSLQTHRQRDCCFFQHVSFSTVSEIDSINGIFKKIQTSMNRLNLQYCALFTAALGSFS